jgi:aspartate dehydrogenase
MTARDRLPLDVGIAGLGAVGLAVAKRLAAGIEGLRLVAVAVRDVAKARAALPGVGVAIKAVTPGELAALCAVIVECLPPKAFASVADPAVAAGRIFMPLSVGQLLDRPDLIETAKRTGARIVVPTGALLGLDAVRAAAEGAIHSARIVTRKPPRGLVGAPYLVERGISLDGLKAPLKVFEGSAREGARGFPANVNVAAALSLAGIGPDRTALEIWADPGIERNTHRIDVDADAARLSMTIENVPSAENPRTGRITALSVVAALRGLVAALKVGS